MAAMARTLGTGWRTIMWAVAEVGTPMIADTQRLAAVHGLGVDEHAWQHLNRRRGTSWAAGIVDLTGGRAARLLEVPPDAAGPPTPDGWPHVTNCFCPSRSFARRVIGARRSSRTPSVALIPPQQFPLPGGSWYGRCSPCSYCLPGTAAAREGGALGLVADPAAAPQAQANRTPPGRGKAASDRAATLPCRFSSRHIL